MSKKTVKLIWEGKTFEFPVSEGTEREQAFDISKLREQTGLVTMDNGFANTSTCESAITFLDGEKGVLHYRGIPIEELAEKSNFLETAHLLIYGNLPTAEEFARFESEIKENCKLPPELVRMFDCFPKGTHPMAIASAVTNALSGCYTEELDPANQDYTRRNIARLMGLFPAIAAGAYRAGLGKTPNEAKSELEYCANFMQMMFGEKGKKYETPKEIVDALHLLLILHADHEQNCSTSTVRIVGSSAANLYTSIGAGISALWGPLHGGANQAVMEMLEEIHRDGGDVKKAVAMAKDKNSSFRLMGFGHRVYKNFDPRAAIIKKACDKVLDKMGVKDPLLDIAKRLEEAALKDPYFVEKKLYPNVDFYSGIIYSALKIPVNMFTVMFALGRLPGWCAHWKEMNDGGKAKIGRPRQVYTGPTKTKYTPMRERSGRGGKKAA